MKHSGTGQPLWVVGLLCLFLAAFGNPCFAASEPHGEHAVSGKRYNVGYTVLDFPCPDGGREKTLTVAVWYPTAQQAGIHSYGGPTQGNVALDASPYEKGGPYPLLVFSHGYGGSGLGAVFFTEALAARGWIVVAPDHHDRYTAVRIRTGRKKHYNRLGLLRHAREIGNSGPEDREAYLYRLDEMKLTLDRILQSERFGKLVDRQKIAVGGHSFGGFTALGLCGTIGELRDERIKGVLLFSTGAGGYLFREDELAAVRMPSMTFIGERERDKKRGSETMAELADKVYGNLAPPKYLLEVRDANHFSFNNRFADTRAARLLSGTEEQFRVIRHYSIAFLERHVAGKKGPERVLEQKDPMLTRYSRR